MRFAVILAGGSGTRLWPLSRRGTPKQLLRLIEGKSLLRLAFERLGDLVPAERVLVCTGAEYADQVLAAAQRVLQVVEDAGERTQIRGLASVEATHCMGNRAVALRHARRR